jgi:quercetin dioxygenase-like cupin family protein
MTEGAVQNINGRPGSEKPRWNQLYFDDWVAREGLDLMRGFKVDNVYTVPLKPWARTGGDAVQIQLDGTGELNAAYVQEIAPGKSLEPQKYLWEELIYVLSGRGATTVWYQGRRKNSFEWQAGSLFTVPLNAWHQHFNVSGDEPTRYIAVTTAPVMMNLIRNDDFIFNNDAIFPERYDSGENFFSSEYRIETFNGWDTPTEVAFTNFVADINAIPFHSSTRGVGTKSASFEVGHGVLGSHTLQIPGGTFSNIHRHGPGAHVLWLKGEGYSLVWPDGGEADKVQAFWGPGTLLVPPSWWWHQHAVVSAEPAQYLALKLSSKRHKVNRLSEGTMRSTRNGGSMLLLEDFPPELMEECKRLFIAECEKRGTPMHMEPIYGV